MKLNFGFWNWELDFYSKSPTGNVIFKERTIEFVPCYYGTLLMSKYKNAMVEANVRIIEELKYFLETVSKENNDGEAGPQFVSR